MGTSFCSVRRLGEPMVDEEFIPGVELPTDSTVKCYTHPITPLVDRVSCKQGGDVLRGGSGVLGDT